MAHNRVMIRVSISGDLHQRLKDESEARGLPMSELAEAMIEDTLPRLPPVELRERQPD